MGVSCLTAKNMKVQKYTSMLSDSRPFSLQLVSWTLLLEYTYMRKYSNYLALPFRNKKRIEACESLSGLY